MLIGGGVKTLSQGTIFIFATHLQVYYFVEDYLRFESGILTNVCSFMFAVVYMWISIYIIKFLGRYFPMMIGK
jgi:hypothetical protein